MLNGRRSQIAIGLSLLLIGLAGLGLAGARALILIGHRHVVVSAFNVDGTEQVSVNCSQAFAATSGDGGGPRDLGWLPSDAVIFLSATSHDQSPAWGFRVTSNGRTVFDETRGHPKVLGFAAEANAVVFAKALTAGGHGIGQVGCQPPGVVAIANYTQSSDDDKVKAATSDESPYRPPHLFYNQIDAWGRWALVGLAALGFIAVLGLRPIRDLAWSSRSGVGGATGALGIVGVLLTIVTTIALGVLLDAFMVAGIVLLFAVSGLLLSGRLESAAGAGGAEG